MVMMKRPGTEFPRRLPSPLPLPFPSSSDAIVDKATFAVMDGDGDGKLSKDEFKRAGWTDERTQSFDGNGDGSVTEAEFTQTRTYEREFNKKDRNGDGALSRTEYSGFAIPILHKGVADLAKPWIDGVKAVRDAAKEAVGGGAAEKAIGEPSPNGESLLSGPKPDAIVNPNILHPIPIYDRFGAADSDKNGSLSREEYIAQRRKEDRPVIFDGPIYYSNPTFRAGTDTLQLNSKKPE
jgi:Ca2+-binding EF-hand superfamily protein